MRGPLPYTFFLALLLFACSPAVPAVPSYESDVRPIFLARCVRCHGAGGMENGDLAPDGALLTAAPPALGPYLDHYEDQNCTPATDGGARPDSCKLGAFSLSSVIGEIVEPSSPTRMPPPPAPSLDDWQIAVVERWVKNPICSNRPNPDPTICPAGAGP
jgi:hypothetical protein